jgi:radical SAM superfamily enzyme YgiQ (UPF0313 family)
MPLPLRVDQTHSTAKTGRGPRFLLVGPYDPKGGEYTFLAPPLGVWRLAGVLNKQGITAKVFDPNCCESQVAAAFEQVLAQEPWDVIGFSTTGMTLQYDLGLAHLARRTCPDACLVAGGMEATFNPERVLRLGPFDFAALGEGEETLIELATRLRSGDGFAGLAGTAWRTGDAAVVKFPRLALNQSSLRDAIFAIPYERMPYRQYWDRLERRCGLGQLPAKAAREARLAEIRSVRLITLNYCPMGCTFCSSTNFLTAAQGGKTARVTRLDEHECLTMLKRIVSTQPDVRTIIFQDDIFVLKQDHRILPLCEAIITAKRRGDLPAALQFISTNRIDAMTPAILQAMRNAGFRVLGFGIESFSLEMLKEFNKAQIHPFIASTLNAALRLRITPFLDMILTSPRCRLEDLATNVSEAYRWTLAGCEVGMYPYVIPFSGSAMATDPALVPHTTFRQRHVPYAQITWEEPCKILPVDPMVRDTILAIEAEFESWMAAVGDSAMHLPSRVRSLVWVLCAVPILRRAGCDVPDFDEVTGALGPRLEPTLKAPLHSINHQLAAVRSR